MVNWCSTMFNQLIMCGAPSLYQVLKWECLSQPSVSRDVILEQAPGCHWIAIDVAEFLNSCGAHPAHLPRSTLVAWSSSRLKGKGFICYVFLVRIHFAFGLCLRDLGAIQRIDVATRTSLSSCFIHMIRWSLRWLT